MSEVVYSDVRFKRPSQPQKRQEPQKPERKFLSDFRCADFPSPSSWKFIAVILAVSCMVLLLSVGLLTVKLNQSSFKAGKFTGNETVKQSSVKPGRFTENKTVCIYPTCTLNWHQRGENCYLFSRQQSHWRECDNFCTGLYSRFLKVDTGDEMDFVINVSKMHSGLQLKFFIGLYYNRELQTWVWYDGENHNINRLKIPGHSTADNKCMQIKYGRMSAEECQSIGYCICKKKIYSAQMKGEK